MRLLLDANLSPRIIDLIAEAGHDVVHVESLGLLSADDVTILQRCVTDERILVTADTDFSMMLALSGASGPSVVLLRGVTEQFPEDHADLLLANLPSLADDLERGAIATITPTRVRVRDLPIQ